MALETRFVILPFFRDADGEIVADEAIEVCDAGRCRRQAERVARARGGALALSRTGDPLIGRWSEAVILVRFGDVPDDLDDFLLR